MVQPDERIALAPEHDHLRTVGVGNQLAAVRELEGLLDGGDGQGEDRAAHRQLHAVHNRQGEGDLDGEGGAFPPLGINGKGTAHLLQILADHVHPHASAGEFGDLLVGGKAGEHDEAEDLLIGVLTFRLGEKAVGAGLLHQDVGIQALSVIGNGNDDFPADVFGGQGNAALGGLALLEALLRQLDAVVHGVADHVHKGVADGFVDGLVHLGIAALGDKIHVLIQLFAHIPDDAVHPLENAGKGHHADGHDHVLELVGELSQLAGGFVKVIQLQAPQFGVAHHHGFGGDDLPHQVHQLVQLGLVDADEALLHLAGAGRRGGGSSGRSRDRGGLGRRGLPASGRGGLSLLGRGALGSVLNNLVGLDVHRVFDGLDHIVQGAGRL